MKLLGLKWNVRMLWVFKWILEEEGVRRKFKELRNDILFFNVYDWKIILNNYEKEISSEFLYRYIIIYIIFYRKISFFLN